MKKLIFTFIISLVLIKGYSQDSVIVTTDDGIERVFTKVEKEAKFPGGIEGWRKYLEANLNANLGNKYIRLRKNEQMAQQTVKLQFKVSKEGKVSDVVALPNADVHPKLAQEAVRVIKQGPDWVPAEQNGRPVIYQAIQYITFQVSRD